MRDERAKFRCCGVRRRTAICLASIAVAMPLVASPSMAQQASRQESGREAVEESSVTAKLRVIQAEYNRAQRDFMAKYREAKTAAERSQAMKLSPNAEAYAKRYIELARQHPDDPEIVRCLTAAARLAYYQPAGRDALRLLANHAGSPHIADAFGMLPYSPHRVEAEALLRRVRTETNDAKTRGLAVYYYGLMLKRSPEVENQKRAEQLFDEVTDQYGEIKMGRGTLADLAERQLFELRFLTVGKTAPEITGEDIQGEKFSLSDYRGKVVLLDFWGDW